MMRGMRPLPRRSVLRLTGLALAGLSLSPRRLRAQDAEPVPALLDGALLSPEDAALANGRPPIAVMIDNLPDGARPQIGLDRADLVYELLVEGGITRFMAVFQRQDAECIEPVRSVRTPYVHLAAELDAILAHIGASEAEGETDARFLMDYWGVRQMDEPTEPAAFWRDNSRYAPHNACTDTLDIRAVAASYGWIDAPRTAPWLFKDDFAPDNQNGGPVGHVAFQFGGDLAPQYDFGVDWYWDPSSNSYLRSMAGVPHRDGRSGAHLWAKNVVLHFDQTRTADHEGHVLYSATGEGSAYVFMDGQVIEAAWSKRDVPERTRYWNTGGDEIRFNRGPTWVAGLPYGSPVTWD
jgi:hypothetical protein